MKVLIADDDPVVRLLLQRLVAKWKHEPVIACDGDEAWKILESNDPPILAMLDWSMPGRTGPELCKLIRDKFSQDPPYVILVTANAERDQVVEGFEAGADDYVTKPFDPKELEARLHVGKRMIELRKALAGKVRDLELALEKVQRLQSLLPVCAWCKKIRNDNNYWLEFETYARENLHANISHGICPECMKKVRKEKPSNSGQLP